MNPLRALIWKEGRESIYKIAIGVCLGLFVGLIPKDDLDSPALLVGLFGAVLMGMDAVAGEREPGDVALSVYPTAGPRLVAGGEVCSGGCRAAGRTSRVLGRGVPRAVGMGQSPAPVGLSLGAGPPLSPCMRR